MEYYKTIRDFGNNVSDVNKIFYSVRDAVPYYNPFFMILLGFLLVTTSASYFLQIRIVGSQRFFNSILSGSFATFFVAVLFSLAGFVSAFTVMVFLAFVAISYGLASFYR